jgi:hypothetical protein
LFVMVGLDRTIGIDTLVRAIGLATVVRSSRTMTGMGGIQLQHDRSVAGTSLLRPPDFGRPAAVPHEVSTKFPGPTRSAPSPMTG